MDPTTRKNWSFIVKSQTPEPFITLFALIIPLEPHETFGTQIFIPQRINFHHNIRFDTLEHAKCQSEEGNRICD